MWGKGKDKSGGKDERASGASFELVTVFVSADPGLVNIARTMLQSADIRFLVPDEIVRTFAGPMAGPTRVQVGSADADRALALLAELKDAGPAGESAVESAGEPAD
jgi:Putative prokaryotic signal transducing protein